jgi:hypothetical protein
LRTTDLKSQLLEESQKVDNLIRGIAQIILNSSDETLSFKLLQKDLISMSVASRYVGLVEKLGAGVTFDLTFFDNSKLIDFDD